MSYYFFRAHRTNDLTKKLEKVWPFECDELEKYCLMVSSSMVKKAAELAFQVEDGEKAATDLQAKMDKLKAPGSSAHPSGLLGNAANSYFQGEHCPFDKLNARETLTKI